MNYFKYLFTLFKIIYLYLWNEKDKFFYDQLFFYIANLNCIFIKILQCSSLNSKIWNITAQNSIEKYLNKVPFDKYEINDDILNNLKKEGFIIKEKPLAAGLISLVYEAKNNDKKFAIKLKRNNIYNKLSSACLELKWILNLFSFIPYIKSLNLLQYFEIYTPIILDQCDFIKEKENHLKMTEYIIGLNNFSIPKLYCEFCNESCLVMEFFDGKNAKELTSSEKFQIESDLSYFIHNQFFLNGFITADAHPGNFIFLNKNNQINIGIIDLGLCYFIPLEDRNNFLEILTRIFNLDNKFSNDHSCKLACKLFLKYYLFYTGNDSNYNKNYNVMLNEINNNLCSVLLKEKSWNSKTIINLYLACKNNHFVPTKNWRRIELAVVSVETITNLIICRKEKKPMDFLPEMIKKISAFDLTDENDDINTSDLIHSDFGQLIKSKMK